MSEKIERIVLMVYAFTFTAPVLTLFGKTWYTWLSLIISLYYLVKNYKNDGINIKFSIYLLIFIFAIFSSFICYISEVPDYLKDEQLINIIWEIIFLILFYEFYSGKDTNGIYFVKGIYYAAIINMIWGFLQLIAYQLFGLKINELIFDNLLHMVSGRTLTPDRGNSIMLTGFTWNAGAIAALMVIGYMLSKKLITKLSFILFALLCGSRTLLLGIGVCVALELCVCIYRSKVLKNRKTMIIILFIVVILGAAMCVPKISNLVISKVTDLLNSLSSSYLSTQTSSRVHARYWTATLQVVQYSGIVHTLFGWGIGCSGHPFSMLFNHFPGYAWVIECDFINILWEYGVIYFMLFYGYFAYNIIKGTKIDYRYFIMFIAILIEGITYNVLLNWGFPTILIIFTLIKNNRNIFEEINIGLHTKLIIE